MPSFLFCMLFELPVCEKSKFILYVPSTLMYYFCFSINLEHTFHFPKKGVIDVVKISGMRSLTAFTVCLWMSSSNNKGTLVSYAVSNSDNELVIEYERYFDFLLGGTQR